MFTTLSRSTSLSESHPQRQQRRRRRRAATGGVVDYLQCTTDAMGYKPALAIADRHATGRGVWAIAGSGQLRSRSDHVPTAAGRVGGSRSTDRPAQPAATAPRPMGSTLSALPRSVIP
jgi:hypothetical protein